MMMFMRNRKIEKILEQYVALHQTLIPDNSVGYEDLMLLKKLNLEELATAYDLLDGYKHFPEKFCPAMSRAYPVFQVRASNSNNKILHLRRLDYYQKFVKAGEFHSYPKFDVRERLMTNDEYYEKGLIWKHL